MRSLFALFAVAALLVSGCSTPPTGSTAGTTQLVRHIVADLTEAQVEKAGKAGSMEGAVATLATVWFEYTHTGAPVPTAELMFKYEQATGAPGVATLAQFTPKATLSEGDRVKVSPTPAAAVFGAVSIVQGEAILAARDGLARNWLTVGKHPVPVAASQDGTTAWEAEAKGGFLLDLRDMDLPATTRLDCGQSGCTEVTEPQGHVDVARFDLQSKGTGTVTVAATAKALTFEAKGDSRMDVDAELRMTTPDESTDASALGFVTAEGRGTAELNFEKGDLKSVYYSHSHKVDGDLDATGMPGLEIPSTHPWSQGSLPRTSLPLNLGNPQVDTKVTKFLLDAFSLDLATGDEVRVTVSGDDGAGKGAQMSYVSQVLGVEERTVGTAARPAFKVGDLLSVKFMEGGKVVKEHKVDLTYWLDLASYLPVYAQSKVQQTLDKASFEDAFGFLRGVSGGEEFPEIPADGKLVFTSDVTQRMTKYGGDLATAAVVGLGAARLVPMFGVLALA